MMHSIRGGSGFTDAVMQDKKINFVEDLQSVPSLCSNLRAD